MPNQGTYDVLIPALNPSGEFVSLAREILRRGARSLIVVDDGSDHAHLPVFERISDTPGATVLRHAVNLGKGAALKTGFNHFLLNSRGDDVALVTADSDGQHLPADVEKVAAEANRRANADLVLGARGFQGEVPFRSRVGNSATRFVFWALIGKPISDTQTGLRAVPRRLIERCLRLRSGGYDFEMDMLVACRELQINVAELRIETVYVDQNRHSHFNPLFDSMRIYFVFLRFLSSSLAAIAVDLSVFSMVFAATKALAVSIACARVAGGALNFTLNRSYVFQSREPAIVALAKYASLVLAFGVISYLLIDWIHRTFGWDVLLAKVCVEGSLFLVSFAAQRELVFWAKGSA